MTEDSMLVPDKLSSQCDSAIKTLQRDNTSLESLNNTISTFIQDDSLKGLAFDNKRNEMVPYTSIITYMIEANDLDINDWNKLKSQIGSESYSGKKILGEQAKALAAQKSDNATADDYYDKATDPVTILLLPAYAAFCYGMYQYYKQLADADYKLYLFWKNKELAFDAIVLGTTGLFTASIYKRALCIKDPSDPNSSGLPADNLGVFSNSAATAIKSALLKAQKELIEYNQLVIKAANCDPVTGLTPDEKDKLITIYEKLNPEHQENMDKALTNMANEGYDEHIRNIKVLAYTANEPYKQFFLDNIGDVVNKSIHHTGTSKFADDKDGGGTYINVDRWTSPLNSATYNVFFHESSHAIDAHLGENGNPLTVSYRQSGSSLKETIQKDVEARINSEINNYVNQYCSGMTLAEIEAMKAEVTDKIMNQVDYKTYNKPTFNDPVTEACYDDVRKNINSFLRGKGSISDTYGGFTGNTLAGDKYHGALYREEDDGQGGTVKVYRVYWIEGTINSDGTGLSINYDNNGNVQYKDSLAKEFFAESMAANMTRENREMQGYNGYNQDTRDFFEDMINSKM